MQITRISDLGVMEDILYDKNPTPYNINDYYLIDLLYFKSSYTYAVAV